MVNMRKKKPAHVPGSLVTEKVLLKMAMACEGDFSSNFLALKLKLQEDEFRFNTSIVHCREYLFKKAQNTQELRSKRFNLLKNIIKHAKKLQSEINSDMPDQTPMDKLDIKTGTIHHTSIVYGEEEADTFINWHTLNAALLEHIHIYECFSDTILSSKRHGRPQSTKALEYFIYCIATFYEEALNRKFTYDHYQAEGKPTPITEGMRFAQAAMDALYVGRSELEQRYSESNFQSACSYVVKKMKGEKNSPKK